MVRESKVVKMYKVGEFSKITNTSIRTLRYYDKIGLLKPSEVDIFTNYRYYNYDNYKKLLIIKRLKSTGFTLDEIINNYDKFTEEIYISKKEELENKILKDKWKINEINNLINYTENGTIILEKEIKTYKKLSLKKHSYDEYIYLNGYLKKDQLGY